MLSILINKRKFVNGVGDQLKVRLHSCRAQAKRDKEDSEKRDKAQKKKEDNESKKWKDS
jgi:hypothetical protein